jgi:hypothetical protein
MREAVEQRGSHFWVAPLGGLTRERKIASWPACERYGRYNRLFRLSPLRAGASPYLEVVVGLRTSVPPGSKTAK